MTTLKSVLRTPLQKIHPGLLVFLVLLLNVKLVVKAVAIGGAMLFGIRSSAMQPLSEERGLLFYPIVICIGLLDALLYGTIYKAHYGLALLFGSGIWMACFLASGQVRRFVSRIDKMMIVRTIAVFFILNAIVSFTQLGLIMWETGALNPYRYQGNFQKYFVNTGDYIKGISFDTSTTNAAINALGVLFFLQKRSWLLLTTCLLTLVLTGSNLVNILLLANLVLLFIFRSGRDLKSVLTLCFLPFVFFWARVSPQNSDYVGKLSASLFKGPKQERARTDTAASKPVLAPSEEEMRMAFARQYLDSVGRKIIDTRSIASEEKPVLPTDNIHTPPFQHRDDTNAVRRMWFHYVAETGIRVDSIQASSTVPGKVQAMQQTISFLSTHPAKAATGAGPGNFSSKLAFKTAALGIGGSYPETYRWIDPSFSSNHLALYLAYFTKQERLHSVANTPNSVYDQLAAEYGLAGVFAFAFLYIGFFLRSWRKLTYGLPMLLLLCGLFATDYWFEQISVVVLCELFLFLNLNDKGHEQ
ncbi:MAG: hypothetical protein JWP27_138 [Flaviaesturariibacter sp.]|nr:hypothetical protein [Flaviaesturariibacter sp.]